MGVVKLKQCGNIHTPHAIPIGEAEALLILKILRDFFQSSSGHGIFSSIHQGDSPRLCTLLMYIHTVLTHTEGYIRHMQEVVGKILFNHIPLVPTTDNKVVDTVSGVDLHNMPEDWLATNFNHRFRSVIRLFTDTGSISSSQDHCFHLATHLHTCLRSVEPDHLRFCYHH